MNVSTITISPDEASAKLAEYRSLAAHERTDDDLALIRLYRAVQRGARVLHLARAFRETGLNQHGQPRLAIARADWPTCTFHPRRAIVPGTDSYRPGGGCFTAARRIDWRLRTNLVNLPAQTFTDAQLTDRLLHTPVPHMPPSVRPTTSWSRFHILFEVERWDEYPVDPFLLRHIAGALYLVEAEWALTPLEASLLSALTA